MMCPLSLTYGIDSNDNYAEHIDEIHSLADMYAISIYLHNKYPDMVTNIKTTLNDTIDERRRMLQIILVLTILRQGGTLTIKIRDPIYNVERYILDRLTGSFLSTRWFNNDYLICDYYLGYNEPLINKLSYMYTKYNPYYGRKKLNF